MDIIANVSDKGKVGNEDSLSSPLLSLSRHAFKLPAREKRRKKEGDLAIRNDFLKVSFFLSLSSPDRTFFSRKNNTKPIPSSTHLKGCVCVILKILQPPPLLDFTEVIMCDS